MGEIKLDGFICERCEHTWLSRFSSEQKPTVCPKCKSPYWHTPRKNPQKKEDIVLKELEESIFPWETKKIEKKVYDDQPK